MRELIRPAVIAAFAALLLLFPAAGQVLDPDPSEPDAQQTAEVRFIGAMLGLTPPPIGWNCTIQTVWYGQMPMVEASCEPDPLLIERQERQRREWEDRLAERHREMRERLGRRR
jgi:hypothetical protein